MGKPSSRIVLDGPFAESKELLAGGCLRDSAPPRGRYALVNGLPMYYEVHGRGRPLLLLHSALNTIDSAFGQIVRALSASRQVIAVEQQAHGRTPDIERKLSQEQMADDTAELLRQLDVEQADVYGFSMGAITALELAVRHSERVRKLAVVAGSFSNDGMDPTLLSSLTDLNPRSEGAWKPRLQSEFDKVGATSDRWVSAIQRVKEVFEDYRGLRPRDLRSIRAETLFIGGDAGWTRLDHLTEMSRLVPKSQLKVFRGDDHHPLMVRRSASMVPAFFDGPDLRV